VTSYYEGDYVTHVIPLMTQPFDFRKRKSIIPRWEELLLFNEDFDYFMSFGSNLGVFFEVVDFVSMAVVNNKSTKARTDQGPML
jgi:jouberin